MPETLTAFQAAALGLLQGLTEFLPVSSSGHLILARHLLGWPETPLAFDVALHLGTAVALLLYFWRTWFALTRRPSGLLLLLIIGSIPIALTGLLLGDLIEARLRGVGIVAAMLIAWGVLLGLADALGAKRKPMEYLGLRGVLLIGVAQAFSLIPGTSRSGATISAGMAMGLTRESAARFSFLLGTPAIIGAGLFEARELVGASSNGLGLGVMLVGVVAALLSSLVTIRLLLELVRRISFWPFVAYRLALGALILLFFW